MFRSRGGTYAKLSPVVLEAPVQVDHTGPDLAILILAAFCADCVADALDVVASADEAGGS